MKRDIERFFKQSMVVLLTLRADCSLLALKPAHSSCLLPVVKKPCTINTRRSMNVWNTEHLAALAGTYQQSALEHGASVAMSGDQQTTKSLWQPSTRPLTWVLIFSTQQTCTVMDTLNN